MQFDQPLSISLDELDWQASPAQGVWRKPLEREAAESGHTTSLVRYQPGCAFNSHPHPLGEEIYVLQGTFSDEFGDAGAGSYLRNPPGSQHAPFSQEGCIIFVKLNQFSPADQQQIRLDTLADQWQSPMPGQRIQTLHTFASQRTELIEWDQDGILSSDNGLEILVLAGALTEQAATYSANTWLRRPAGRTARFNAKAGSRVLVKSGHLPD